MDQDRSQVLGIHDSRYSPHLDGKVGHRGLDRQQPVPLRGRDPDALFARDEFPMGDVPQVGIEGAIGAQLDKVTPPLAVDQQGLVSFSKDVSRPDHLELIHLGDDLVEVEFAHARVEPLEAHDALFVDYEHRTPGCALLLVVYVVKPGYLPLGMEVGQDRVRYTAQRRREGGLRSPRIGAYTQDLGILLLEVRVDLPERGDLVGSAAGKGVYVKRQNDVLLTPILAKGDVILGLRHKDKVRSRLSYIDHKSPPESQI